MWANRERYHCRPRLVGRAMLFIIIHSSWSAAFFSCVNLERRRRPALFVLNRPTAGGGPYMPPPHAGLPGYCLYLKTAKIPAKPPTNPSHPSGLNASSAKIKVRYSLTVIGNLSPPCAPHGLRVCSLRFHEHLTPKLLSIRWRPPRAHRKEEVGKHFLLLLVHELFEEASTMTEEAACLHGLWRIDICILQFR